MCAYLKHKKNIVTMTSKTIPNTLVDTREVDKQYVNTWLNNRTLLNLTSKTSLNECYECYTIFLQRDEKKVPLTKTSFSSLFRDFLKHHEDQAKIRFYHESSLFIKKIELVSSTR